MAPDTTFDWAGCIWRVYRGYTITKLSWSRPTRTLSLLPGKKLGGLPEQIKKTLGAKTDMPIRGRGERSPCRLPSSGTTQRGSWSGATSLTRSGLSEHLGGPLEVHRQPWCRWIPSGLSRWTVNLRSSTARLTPSGAAVLDNPDRATSALSVLLPVVLRA